MIESRPLAKSSSVISTFTSGAMPNSVVFPSASYIGQAEKRTPQPFGNSLENGIPAPPPVVSPMIVTDEDAPFRVRPIAFMHFTNSFAALYTDLLVRTQTGLRQRIPLPGCRYCASIAEKSECPLPVLCWIYPTNNSSSVKREASF